MANDRITSITTVNYSAMVTMPSEAPNMPKNGFITNYWREVFQVVNIVIICGPLSVFGIGANIVNMVVFIKQGFKDSINISLLGLAVSDLACMLTVFWMSIGFNPAVAQADPPFDPVEMVYLTSGWPHECFNRATSFITAFVTLERCLCITTPLKVKTIITPLRTKIIITGIFVLMLASFSPTYFVNSLQWKFSDELNRTMLTIHYAENRLIVEIVSFLIHSVLMSGISLIVVIVSTVVLVVKLNEKARWRHAATGGTRNGAKDETSKEAFSSKDKKVVKMITIISIIFIICFVPPTFIFFMMAYDPQFSVNGRYHNTFVVAWSSAFILETINSSVNIFIYVNMSSKFKTTLIDLSLKIKRK